MDSRFVVDSNVLTAHLARPARKDSAVQAAVVIVHGFPTEPGGGINSTLTMPALADLIAAETGFAALTYASRGVAGSSGDFSLGGWRSDLAGAVDYLASEVSCDGIWLIGFGTGGALAVVVASRDERVRGVAAVASPADFEDWARNPRKLLVWAREVGVVRDPSSLSASIGGPRRSGQCGPSTRPSRWETGRCSCCTAATMRPCPCSTPGCSPMPTRAPI